MKAAILASDLKKASTGRVTVQNPAPGGGLSPIAFLPVRTPAAQVNFKLVPVKTSAVPPGSNGRLLTQAIDVNNDGNLDFVSSLETSPNSSASAQEVDVQLGTKNGSFHRPIVTQAFQGVFVVGTGDFNGDGNIDLIVEGSSILQEDPHILSIMLGNGDGTFQAPRQIADPAT